MKAFLLAALIVAALVLVALLTIKGEKRVVFIDEAEDQVTQPAPQDDTQTVADPASAEKSQFPTAGTSEAADLLPAVSELAQRSHSEIRKELDVQSEPFRANFYQYRACRSDSAVKMCRSIRDAYDGAFREEYAGTNLAAVMGLVPPEHRKWILHRESIAFEMMEATWASIEERKGNGATREFRPTGFGEILDMIIGAWAMNLPDWAVRVLRREEGEHWQRMKILDELEFHCRPAVRAIIEAGPRTQ